MSALRRGGRSLALRAADARDTVRGRRDRFTPPRRLAGFVGDSDFAATGAEFVELFRELAGLTPEDRVLDIGCGIGRMARVLVPVLRPPGRYDGFDIWATGIDWCRRRYTGTPAPFRFAHADVQNQHYNPGGALGAEDFTFPYPDGAFDLVLATSLFTHLLPSAAARYLAEAARVTAPGGRLFLTWLLLEEPEAVAGFEPLADHPPARSSDPGAPEAAVAYPLGWLRAQLAAGGLELAALHRGHWRGSPGRSFQDIVIAHHAGAGPPAAPAAAPAPGGRR